MSAALETPDRASLDQSEGEVSSSENSPRVNPRATLFHEILNFVAPIAIGSVAAFAGAHLLTPMYAARAELVLQLPTVPEIPEQYKATQEVIASGRTVLGPVSSSFHIPVDKLEARLSIDFPKGSSTMRLQYADADSTVAVSVLNAILDGYLSVTSGLEQVTGASHELIVPPFPLEQAISPRPLQAAAMGAVVGLAFSILAFAFRHRARTIP